jgi:helix-turn-helix protein
MAKSEEERAEVDTVYEVDRAAGPDFTRYHKGSGIGELAPEHQLDRNDRHKVLVAFDVIRKGTFEHCRVLRRRPAVQGAADDATRRGIQALEDDLRKIGADEASINAAVVAYREERAEQAADQPVGGSEQSRAVVRQAAPPLRNYRAVLDVLLGYAVRFGRVYPRLATIAREAGASVRTVQNAIDWLRRFGFVERVRRLVRERSRLGGVRCRQTSNAYRVGFPTGIGRLAQSVFRRVAYATGGRASTTRNTCHPSRSSYPPMTTDPLGEVFGDMGFSVREPGCRRSPSGGSATTSIPSTPSIRARPTSTHAAAYPGCAAPHALAPQGPAPDG